MGWLVRHNWLWALLAFVLGAAITWFLLARREQSQAKVAPGSRPARRPRNPRRRRGSRRGRRSSSRYCGRRAAPAARGTSRAPNGGAGRAFDQTHARGTRRLRPEPLPEPEPVELRRSRPAPVVQAKAVAAPAFSRRMDVENGAEPTCSTTPSRRDDGDKVQAEKLMRPPPGRYGEGSAEAVPHQGPPDGFTIKGNAQSMLFHTPDSPYYGRTKPEVWFRSRVRRRTRRLHQVRPPPPQVREPRKITIRGPESNAVRVTNRTVNRAIEPPFACTGKRPSH